MGTGYTFFWSGLHKVARRIHGVGFTVRTALLQNTQKSTIAIDERLMTHYEALKGVNGPSRFSLHPVRSTDGIIIKNKKLMLEIWAEYL